MRKTNKSTTMFLLGIFSFILLLFYTHSVPPTYLFHAGFFTLPSNIPFFILFFLTLFGFGTSLLKSSAQGMVAGLFGILFLFLRMLGFSHWFFTFLLVSLFGVIELFLLQKN